MGFFKRSPPPTPEDNGYGNKEGTGAFDIDNNAALHGNNIGVIEAHGIRDASPNAAGRTVDELNVPVPPHTTHAKLMRRIDLRVVPFLALLYLVAFLDRINIANAKVFYLADDLKLSGVQYNTALTIFFVPYVVFELASNIMLKRFSPRVWLSCCGMGFAAVTVFQGLVQNYSGLLATRFFLGLFECGMFPGCFYLLGMWYRREDAQRRYSFFFSSTSLAGAFGGLLASAIGKMDKLRGYRGWRWIFILEGSVSFLICFIFLFTFPSFPEQAKWLREDEREYLKARLRADQGNNAAERKVTFRDILTVLRDYKIILGGFMYFGLIVPAYSYAFFSPTIIATYHYGPIQTQLHSVPPWATAFGFSMIVAYLSDKTRHRFLFTIGPICLPIAGFSMLLAIHDNVHAEYAALFLICAGTYSAMPVIVCWFSMNLGGHHRRAIGIAWQIGFGNIGGIIATYCFISTDAPKFTKGYAICIGFVLISAISCCLYFAALVMENRRREKAVRDVGMTEYEKTELGDLNPDFRYML
ncbi:major facilitator superfamily transporter [Sporothrix brasiliensis 5110]|uniref:Major facilitator superfamily transporter n=1 Tax=Sporothrix brasiliensis 5110 TaxID=1398154 RepID=A0A0C2IWL3_9PEZI|nr:major facilitator superfamily transporter [Sporothrix brasiliensis 5110]KIH89397.1 major facilitator superfamily transporter [Sporothrix brasiliensis 5110]